MNEFIATLNPTQREAVLAVNGPVKIIAGAGSGKTRVITYKIAYLIKYLTLAPWTICALTFTNKACEEMKNRVISIIGEQGKKCQIFTYHALCARILREEISYFNYPTSFAIMDGNDQDQIIRKIYRSFNDTASASILKTVKSKISEWKMNFLSYTEVLAEATSIEEKQYAKVYEIYQKTLQEYNSLDFNDLLLFVYQLFTKAPEILAKWQARFNYFLVDEFQDTNEIQFEIINLLVKTHKNITVVGDPDQTIYSWRGAKMSIILNFEHYFPQTETIILNQNYRSTSQILQLANGLIKNNKNRIKKDLFTINDNGVKPIIFQAENSSDEANFVAHKIKELIKDQNYQLQDILILYRANYLSRELEMVLSDYGINYQIIGAFKFYERKEIKDCIALLRALLATDLLAVERILLNIEKFGQVSTDNVLKILKEHNITLFELLANNQHLLPTNYQTKLLKLTNSFIKAHNLLASSLSISDAFWILVSESGYLDQIESNFEIDRKENILELKASIEKFDIAIDKKEYQSGFEVAKNYLELIALQTNSALEEEKNKVLLMTIHNAKGLENKIVFVVGLNEQIFPTSQAIRSGNDSIEEERRTFYVAITRAKEILFISYAGGYSYITRNELYKSRFLEELQSEFYEIETSSKLAQSNKFNYDRNFSSSVLTTLQKNQLKNDLIIIWQIGDELNHEIFGQGVVIKIIANNIQVKFANNSTKIIAADSGAVTKKE